MEEGKEVEMTDTTIRGADSVERAQHAADAGPAPVRRRQMSASSGSPPRGSSRPWFGKGDKFGAESRQFAGLGANLPPELHPVRLAAKQSRQGRLTSFSRNGVVIGCFGRW